MTAEDSVSVFENQSVQVNAFNFVTILSPTFPHPRCRLLRFCAENEKGGGGQSRRG
jgi:hypothetical protein